MLPNGKVESVDSLLASLHYGERKEDRAILEQLSAIFGVPAGTNLRTHLITSVDFSKLFAELVKLVEPFAQMMKEIYEFLSEQQNTANASQRLVVGESIQDEITFDLQVFPEVYQRVIQQIEEYLQVYDLEKMRNRDISPLFYTEYLLSFGHCTHPQYAKKNACQECDLAFRARVEKVFQQLREMVDLIPAEMKIDDPLGLPCGYFEQAYEHFRSRTSITDDCLGYGHWKEIFDILERRIALVSEKQLGHRDVEVLLHFFELPFWQERDRLYEVWVLIHFIDLLVREGFKVDLNREQEPKSQKWQWRLDTRTRS